MASDVSIEEEIKARAYRLGFSLAGITSPSPLQGHYLYEEWLQSGNQADMQYLASDRHIENRKDPHTLVPWVSSILVLGLPYQLHSLPRLHDPGFGLVSGYAAGEDYHTRIPKLLSLLLESLDELFGCRVQTRIFTDSAPVLERELGVRAGLGWIGRNSCLISPSIGSSFLLAEVFIDQQLEPDSPFHENRCGSCQRCVQACPTGCILPNRTIDSRRCLSYHTIENRGQIPTEIADKIGPWIFGCDVCQMVCPWNHKRAADIRIDQEPIAFSEEDMRAILQIDEPQFKSTYGQSAFSRAKLTGIKRNISIRLQCKLIGD